MTPDPFEREAERILDECWEQTELRKPRSAKKIIAQALTKADQNGYERARKDLSAVHGAKWAKEDFNKGFASCREKAVIVAMLYSYSEIANRIAQNIKDFKPSEKTAPSGEE